MDALFGPGIPDVVVRTVEEAGQVRISVAEVVAAVDERRSAWHRLDVIQHLGDTVRPRPGIDGRRWAQLPGRAVDTVLDDCVDLDPTDSGRRRRSDGRSVWIEPSARHHTSEHILSWAIDHQLDPPQPSTTIIVGHSLDAMQAEAAATVAGQDRLVLVVGPAGAGKTTMLHASVADLGVQGGRCSGSPLPRKPPVSWKPGPA
jgi:hypothetical protein